jgi:hypothetical protein
MSCKSVSDINIDLSIAIAKITHWVRKRELEEGKSEHQHHIVLVISTVGCIPSTEFCGLPIRKLAKDYVAGLNSCHPRGSAAGPGILTA